MEPEEETLPYVIERIGDDKILFASDYPHWDGMFPYVTATIRGRKDISEQTKNRAPRRKRQTVLRLASNDRSLRRLSAPCS